jgi:hypothetical protein
VTENADDTLSVGEIQAQVQEHVGVIVDSAVANAEAVGVELAGEEETAAQEEAGEDVEGATGGAVSSNDYQAATPTPNFSSTGTSVFGQIVEQGKQDLLNEAVNNANAFTRKALETALELIEDTEALLFEISSEAAKVSVASAAGLLIPPNREDVRSLRDDVQKVNDESEKAVVDLKASKSKRDAARRHLETDPGTPPLTHEGTNPVDGRFIEPVPSFTAGQIAGSPTNLNQGFSVASLDAPSLEAQASKKGKASTELDASTAALQGSVLDKISYIAICVTIAGLSTNRKTSARAQKAFARIQAVIDAVMGSLETGFVTNLQNSLQELATDTIDNIANAVQDKLDAFDTFLATGIPQLPTFVATVNAIGDLPNDIPILDSLAAQCDLTITSFCDMQGLLEVAKSLDAQLGLIPPRPPAFGRIRMVVVAPEPEDIVPPAIRPDSELRMLLVGDVTPGSTQVVARLQRSEIVNDISAPVPPLAGNVTEDQDIGAQTILISGLPINIAGLGSVTINPGPLQKNVRYSTFESEGPDTRFTLIDPLPVAVSAAGPGTPVSVTGEQRNTFQGAFEPTQKIKGGPGRLVLQGDGEQRQQLDYDSSTFDVATGEYTFVLTVPSATDSIANPGNPPPDHKFLLLCRPHQTERTIMFKDRSNSGLVKLGERFKVDAGDLTKIVHNTDADFDFTDPAGGTLVITDAQRYDSAFGGQYRLCVGTNQTPVEIDSAASVLSGVGTFLKLKSSFYGGAQERVTLCEVESPIAAGSSTIRMKLDRRQKDDMRVAGLLPGNTTAAGESFGRVIIDGGGATTTRGDFTTNIANSGAVSGAWGTRPSQTLTSAAPLIRGDEEDMRPSPAFNPPGAIIDVQSAKSSFTARIYSTDPAARTIRYYLLPKTGTVTVVATSGHPTIPNGQNRQLNGTGTKFKSEFKVGDSIGVGFNGGDIIQEIVSDTLMYIASVTLGANAPIYMTAPDGAKRVAFTVHREPRETRDFSSVTNIDDIFYDLNLVTPTTFVHALQEPEIPTTVHILPLDDFSDFRFRFNNSPLQNPNGYEDSLKPRFDGDIVPPGSGVIRATFETEEAQPLLGGLVEQATKITAKGSDLIVNDPNTPDADLVYSFDLASPLTFPLTGGDIIEVETTSVFDQLKDLFPDTSWANEFDELFADLAEQLNRMESQICLMLAGGRPQDLALTAAAISATAGSLGLALFPMRIIIQALILGLPKSIVIDRTHIKFRESGMDSAAAAVEDGDVTKVSQLTPTTATSEGQARASLQCYVEELVLHSQVQIVDNMIAQLAGRETDKTLLALLRRPYNEIVKEKFEAQQLAATNLQADADEVTG